MADHAVETARLKPSPPPNSAMQSSSLTAFIVAAVWVQAQKRGLDDMNRLYKQPWRKWASLVRIMVAAIVIPGCARLTNPAPALTPARLPVTIAAPNSTTTPTPMWIEPQAITSDARTPAPNTVEVVLAVAPDSSAASFAVRNADGDLVFQTHGSLVRECVVYLSPGDYTWSANVPVPTAPVGCFVVEENTGFWKDGSFAAVKERVEIRVRFIYVVSYCTPTPGTP